MLTFICVQFIRHLKLEVPHISINLWLTSIKRVSVWQRMEITNSKEEADGRSPGHDLPQDLVLKIIQRLPLRPLFRCTIVSKARRNSVQLAYNHSQRDDDELDLINSPSHRQSSLGLHSCNNYLDHHLLLPEGNHVRLVHLDLQC